MRKLFISQPMNGLSDQEILVQRERTFKAVRLLYDEDFTLIESFIPRPAEEVRNMPVRFLAESIALLSDADVAVFAQGWRNARGCKIEHQICEAYGIPTLSV